MVEARENPNMFLIIEEPGLLMQSPHRKVTSSDGPCFNGRLDDGRSTQNATGHTTLQGQICYQADMARIVMPQMPWFFFNFQET